MEMIFLIVVLMSFNFSGVGSVEEVCVWYFGDFINLCDGLILLWGIVFDFEVELILCKELVFDFIRDIVFDIDFSLLVLLMSGLIDE